MAAVERPKCEPGKHNYQPRHDDITNANATSSANFWNAVAGKTARISDKIWIGDVCTLCGDFIARPRAVK